MHNFFRMRCAGGRLSATALTFALFVGCGSDDGGSTGSGGTGGGGGGGNDQPLAELKVSALYTTVPVGLKQPLTVMAETEEEGVFEDVTPDATFTFEDGSGLSISDGNVLIASAEGPHTVTASIEGHEPVELTVEVLPADYLGVQVVAPKQGIVTMPAGYSSQYRAEAKFQLESGALAYYDVSTVSSWTPSGNGVTVDSTGLVLAETAGVDATVTAAYTAEGYAVDPATAAFSTVEATPSGVTVSRQYSQDGDVVGYSTPLKAVMTYTYDSTKTGTWDVTREVAWTSDNHDVAPDPVAGVVEPVAAGSAVVTAKVTGGVKNTVTINSQEVLLESVSVDWQAPRDNQLWVGETATLVATGHFEENVSKHLSEQAEWITDAAFSVNDDSGQLTAVGVSGEVAVTAVVGGQSGEKKVSAAQLPEGITGVVIDPATSTSALPGYPVAFTAVSEGSGEGNGIDVTQLVDWTVESADIDNVSIQNGGAQAGLFVAETPGDAIVTAVLLDVPESTTDVSVISKDNLVLSLDSQVFL